MIRVIDTETTGFEGEVIELARTDISQVKMVEGDNLVGGWNVGDTIAHLCDPGCLIEFGAMATHHITDEDVKDKPLLSEIIKEHRYYEATTPLDPIEAYAMHYAKFDLARLANLAPTNAPIICTWKLACYLAPKLDSHSNWAMAYALRLKLDPSRSHPPHRAGPDTYVTANVLVRALSKLTVAEAIKISSEPALLYRCPIAASAIGDGRYDSKHKDLTFDQIDPGYLRWIIDNIKDNEDLTHTAKTELRRRGMSI